jgi:hypothetical protein
MAELHLSIQEMIERLYDLYYFIEDSIRVEYCPNTKRELEAKLRAIATLVKEMPNQQVNIIKQFEYEKKRI